MVYQNGIYNQFVEENIVTKKELKFINSLINKSEKIMNSKFIKKYMITISSLEIDGWNIFIDNHEGNGCYDSIGNYDLNIEYKFYFGEWYRIKIH